MLWHRKVDGRIVAIASSGFVEGELIITQFVLAELQFIADSIDSNKKITLDFVEVDIRRVFALISETAGQPIVPSSEVQGTITLRMIDVPWPQALEAILSIYNLKRIDEGSVIRIFPRGK